MAGIAVEIKYEIAQILAMTPIERIVENKPCSMRAIAEHFNISDNTVRRIRADLNTYLARAEEGVDEDVYNSLAFLKSRSRTADENLMRACAEGSPAALKLYKQLTGDLVEKQEVKIVLTADEIARRNLEAERQLKVGYRVEEVQDEPPLLSD